ncbi:MAG: DEAD/DEAH box helicase family protein [Victivallales bacterium]|nr:DEAD/DEAH box helicase family protein [Victivallales bacterium]
MLELKQYQQRCLDVLRRYFRLCGESGDAAASYTTVAQENFTGQPPYHALTEYRSLAGIPYVCLRVPTGGGKTLLACHSLSIAMSEYKRQDSSLVLWLVPSNAILEQTYAAISNPSHPYHQALAQSLGGFSVKRVEEALYLSRGDADGRTCIIISTIQAFRRDNKDGLRVYRSSGNLQCLFDGAIIHGLSTALEKDAETGEPAFSLANAIAMRHPIVVVDEAHNARTPLTFDVLEGFRPACILEFTATPDTRLNPSNVLYAVSAQELKAEEMIKLPIAVEGMASGDWRILLQRAINCRNDLEAKARLERQTTGEYIRPIMLLQAQRKSAAKETFHADSLKSLLINDFKIPVEQIAIATGDIRGIDNVNLLSPDCEIRYVITQQALREGWDCPFAYVLCSLFDTSSKMEVEQILGRVMRMPRAKRKVFGELNCAYAFAPTGFENIAASLKDALTQSGFQRFEAQSMIQQISHNAQDSDTPLFDALGITMDTNGNFLLNEIEIPVENPAPAATIPSSLAHKLEVHADDAKVLLKGIMTDDDRDALNALFPQAKDAIQKAYEQSRPVVAPQSPAERGERIVVPRLAVKVGEQLELFDETVLLDRPMDLAQLDASMPDYSPQDAWIQMGRIDAEGNTITTEVIRRIQEEAKLFDFDAAHNWTMPDLVSWLDSHIEHSDMPAAAATAFFARTIAELISRNLTLETLVLDRFHLADVLRNKLAAFREQCRQSAYRQFLLPDCETPLCVPSESPFQFKDAYPVQRRYEGGYKFKKHFHALIGAFDGKEGGEEELCAQYIDQMDEVDCWVRNLDSRQNESFWLQLHNRHFYPDFVCRLKDGRILVVEHKGADRYSNEDSAEKRTIGELWANRSHGHCLFVMTCGKNFHVITDALK